MHFSKMHGCGNDYIYINCLEKELENPSELAVTLSDRHFGIGSDGLVAILPSEKADFRMRMWNADGSEGNMCGNAIRCVGKYLYDNKICSKTSLAIETRSGIKQLRLHLLGDVVDTVEVDMGKADFLSKHIPILTEKEWFINEPITVGGREYTVTCVSMGNPHCVTYVDDTSRLPLEQIGPLFENHSLFPQRINTEFVQVIDSHTLQMRVWERGSGETFACGTGACACVAASVLNGKCSPDTEITVVLRGGKLYITYHRDGTVTMRGSATFVFEGDI